MKEVLAAFSATIVGFISALWTGATAVHYAQYTVHDWWAIPTLLSCVFGAMLVGLCLGYVVYRLAMQR